MRIRHFAATIGIAAVLALPICALADNASPAGQAADPSIAQIYQAAEGGDTARADRMIAQVLQDHPDSAKAHYVHAELLSKEGKLGAARDELARAEKLAPGLPFAKPEATAQLRERLAQGSAPPRRAEAPAGSMAPAQAPREQPSAGAFGFSPGKLALGVLAIAALFFVFRRFAGSPRGGGLASMGGQGPQGPGPGGMPSYGGVPAGYGYAPGSMAPGAAPAGSGLGGALMTGAAVGLGAVAVEEAVRHFSHRDEPRVVDADDRRIASGSGSGSGSGGNDWGQNLGPDVNADMGGNDFGISDAGSWDDGGGGVDPGSDWN